MSFLPSEISNHKGFNLSIIILIFLLMNSCGGDDSDVADSNRENEISNSEIVNINMASNDMLPEVITEVKLPQRTGNRPETTTGVPHVQIGVKPVTEVNEELIRRVFSIPGIVKRTSVVGYTHGMWLHEDVIVFEPQFIGGLEFGHIHDDGSLHIFLEPTRSFEAVQAGWAIDHPFAEEGREGWDGFVMLYTPQSMEELDWVFQLIVDGFNYVTGQNLIATDYY